MALVWSLAEIRTEVRAIAGRSSTDDISDADANNLINDYYQNHFPEETQVFEFFTDWTQDTSVSDDGEYDLAQTVISVEKPIVINKQEACVTFDKGEFFRNYPDIETYVSNPTLAIGTSATTAVKNAAFTHRIADVTYTVAAGETALSGDTVPQSLYGAWLLTVGTDGTVDITEAPANGTGYATAALAVAAISSQGSTVTVMGFVTAINTSATFVPGTTGLDAAGVTDTFTDGNPTYRATPYAVLIYGGSLFVRPKACDIFRIESQLTLQRPAVLATDGDVVGDIQWGPAIAVRVAQLFLASRKAMEEAAGLELLVRDRMGSIGAKKYLQWKDRRPLACL